MSGTEVYKLKTRDGQSMRDVVLVDSLKQDDPWVESIYKQGSGFVHFSMVHVVGTYGKPDRAELTLPVAITGEDNDFPNSVYLDTISTFRAAIRIFVDHLVGWIRLKEHPNSSVISLIPLRMVTFLSAERIWTSGAAVLNPLAETSRTRANSRIRNAIGIGLRDRVWRDAIVPLGTDRNDARKNQSS